MALSQLFWDVLMPWNLKSTYFSLKMIHFLSLNIWYVIYVVFWIKYWNLKLPHHCILFLFTICTVSQLFWNRVCIYNFVFIYIFICVCVQNNINIKYAYTYCLIFKISIYLSKSRLYILWIRAGSSIVKFTRWLHPHHFCFFCSAGALLFAFFIVFGLTLVCLS